MARAKKAAARPAWEPLVGEDKIVALETALKANGWRGVHISQFLTFGGARSVELYAAIFKDTIASGEKDVSHRLKVVLLDDGTGTGRETWTAGASCRLLGLREVSTLDEAIALAMAAKPDGLP